MRCSQRQSSAVPSNSSRKPGAPHAVDHTALVRGLGQAAPARRRDAVAHRGCPATRRGGGELGAPVVRAGVPRSTSRQRPWGRRSTHERAAAQRRRAELGDQGGLGRPARGRGGTPPGRWAGGRSAAPYDAARRGCDGVVAAWAGAAPVSASGAARSKVARVRGRGAETGGVGRRTRGDVLSGGGRAPTDEGPPKGGSHSTRSAVRSRLPELHPVDVGVLGRRRRVGGQLVVGRQLAEDQELRVVRDTLRGPPGLAAVDAEDVLRRASTPPRTRGSCATSGPSARPGTSRCRGSGRRSAPWRPRAWAGRRRWSSRRGGRRRRTTRRRRSRRPTGSCRSFSSPRGWSQNDACEPRSRWNFIRAAATP